MENKTLKEEIVEIVAIAVKEAIGLVQFPSELDVNVINQQDFDFSILEEKLQQLIDKKQAEYPQTDISKLESTMAGILSELKKDKSQIFQDILTALTRPSVVDDRPIEIKNEVSFDAIEDALSQMSSEITDGLEKLEKTFSKTQASVRGLYSTPSRIAINDKNGDKINPAMSGEKSTLNSTTVLLGSGETYTGTAETNNHPQVGVYCVSDTDGTLYFEWGDGNGNFHDFPTAGYAVIANIPEFQPAVKFGRPFRVRFVNSASAQSTFSIDTYYGDNFTNAVSPIGTTIGTDAPAQLVKAVISGVGDTNARVTDHQALQVTPPPEGKTAFGETIVVEPAPVVQLDFPYDTNLGLINIFENQSGTITHSNHMLTVNSGAASNSSGEFRSKRIIKYNPGQGAMVRFTAKFTTGVANNTQMIGVGNESDGFFFGYNGTAFGILHRRNGAPEIRTLTVSTGSSNAENITITLDGDTASVAVTASGSADTTAQEIAAHDYSDVGAGWTAKQIGSKVEFKSWDGATHSGTFSLSGATSAVGTFAQNVVGTEPTETWVAQTSWNGEDIFDGNGLTGVTLDPTKGNVYQIKYQWLGFGLITFYIEDPDDGELHLVHGIEYSNANTTPSISDPSLALMARSANTSNTSNITLQTASMAGFIEGKTSYIGVRLGVENGITAVGTSYKPILTIRQGQYKNSHAVQTFSKIMRLGAAVNHNKPMTIAIIEDGTLTGASFSRVDSTSAIESDISATAITGGIETFEIPLGPTGNEYISFVDDYFAYNIPAGKTITIAAKALSGTTGEAVAGVKVLERI